MTANVQISFCFLSFQVHVLLGLHILACEWTERPLNDCTCLFDIPHRFHRPEFMYFSIYLFFPLQKQYKVQILKNL